jgi:hypothetical protein
MNNAHKPVAPRVPAKEPEPALREALERRAWGEKAGRKRVTIRFVKCSTRLSDRGNLAGGYKALLDQLRYTKLIDDDDPQTIFDSYEQIRVAKRKECGTWIEITIPD